MSWIEILLIALGVSVDAFAVSVGGAMGCQKNTLRNSCNAGLFFGGFQFLMPLAGFFAAAVFTGFVNKYDHWCAFGLLALVGGKMIYDGLKKGQGQPEEPAVCQLDFFSPAKLFIPAIATSLDALAVGGSIAFAGNTTIWVPAICMGVVTGIISFMGVELGYKLKTFGCEKLMSAIGGAVIVLIGVRILVSHLF